MSWGVLFRIRQYLKGSLWFFPLLTWAVTPRERGCRWCGETPETRDLLAFCPRFT